MSSTVQNLTLWTTSHEPRTHNGKKLHSLVEEVDTVTAFGHRRGDRRREELNLKGNGPEWLLTEWGIFDFPGSEYAARLRYVWPDVDPQTIRGETVFDFEAHQDLDTIPLPEPEDVEFIRRQDPLEIRKKEFRESKLERKLEV